MNSNESTLVANGAAMESLKIALLSQIPMMQIKERDEKPLTPSVLKSTLCKKRRLPFAPPIAQRSMRLPET